MDKDTLHDDTLHDVEARTFPVDLDDALPDGDALSEPIADEGGAYPEESADEVPSEVAAETLAPYGPPIPTPPSESEAEGEPDMSESEPLIAASATNDDAEYLIADEPRGVDEWGTLPSEEAQPEPLSIRLERELPDDEAYPEPVSDSDLSPATSSNPDGTPRLDAASAASDTSLHSPDLPRLVSEDQGVGEDSQKELSAYSTIDRDGLTAEEAAMHVEPESDPSGTFDAPELYSEE